MKTPHALLMPLTLLMLAWFPWSARSVRAGDSAPKPAAEPGNAGSEVFEHDGWTTVLQRFVDARGLVDYDGLDRDREVFERYLHSVETYSPESHPNLFPTRDHALAYYLNAYNAHVFAGVLSRGPEKKSVWRGLISGLEFFGRMKIVVGGRRTNLKKLEDVDIREGFEDPRVHAALNCASIGCPPLPREAFEPSDLQAQLDKAMSQWVMDPAHCRVDTEHREVVLNKIFDWFSGDFLSYELAHGNPEPSLVSYINRYRSQDVQIPKGYEVRFSEYDKAINSQD